MARTVKRQWLPMPLAARWQVIPLALVLAVGAALRWYGLDWDQGQLLIRQGKPPQDH